MAENVNIPETSKTTANKTKARSELSIDEFLQKIDLSNLADIFKEEEVTMDTSRHSTTMILGILGSTNMDLVKRF